LILGAIMKHLTSKPPANLTKEKLEKWLDDMYQKGFVLICVYEDNFIFYQVDISHENEIKT
jgi:hypothetical protein